MKVMFVTNKSIYSINEGRSGWNMLTHIFKEKFKIKCLRKQDLLFFYFHYLKFKPDLIVGSWVPAGIIPILFKLAGLVNCPIVHAWDDYYAEQMTKYPNFIVRLMELFAVKFSDYITTMSKYNQGIAEHMGKKVFFIPHGVSMEKNKTKINLDKLKVETKNIKAIYLGEQSKYKKVDEIIKAVNGLNCDLFLFGKTNEEFREIASKNVHFMGYVDPREVFSILEQADILINPSDQDSNFKFFEYIRVGKPILCFNGRPKFLFKHKENAYLTKDFKLGLKELIENKKLREKLEKNLKKMKTLTWEQVAEEHIKVYKEAIKKC
jgi:glycosyltransferase involved in cell wall biosynthesis